MLMISSGLVRHKRPGARRDDTGVSLTYEQFWGQDCYTKKVLLYKDLSTYATLKSMEYINISTLKKHFSRIIDLDSRYGLLRQQ